MNKVNQRNSSKKCVVNSGLQEVSLGLGDFELTNTSSKSKIKLNGLVNGVSGDSGKQSSKVSKKKNKSQDNKKDDQQKLINNKQTPNNVEEIKLHPPEHQHTSENGEKAREDLVGVKENSESNRTGTKPKRRDLKPNKTKPKENPANEVGDSVRDLNSLINYNSSYEIRAKPESAPYNFKLGDITCTKDFSADELIADLSDIKLDDVNRKQAVEPPPAQTPIEPPVPIDYVQYESELQMPMIVKLIQKDLSEPYSIYTYRYFIHNWPKLCFLAMSDGICVGAIVCKLDLHRDTRRGYIAMLAVDEGFRKRGIGSTLVRKAIQEMMAGDAEEVVLETEITNKPALQLYEALGFVRDKRLFRYYLNGVDALRLKLWLR